MISFDIWSGQATSKHVLGFCQINMYRENPTILSTTIRIWSLLHGLSKTLYAMNSPIKSPQLIFKNLMFVVVYI